MNKNYFVKRKNAFTVISLIIFIGFSLSIYVVTFYLSSYHQTNEYKKLVLEADRLSSIEKNISFEQALKLFNSKIPINVYNQSCEPLFTNDLLILSNNCLQRSPTFNWIELQGSHGRQLIVAFNSNWLNFENFYNDVGLYLVMISLFFLVFIGILVTFFYYLFINAPLRKVSQMVDTLLETKSVESVNFAAKPDEMLFQLYDCIHKMITEVIKFNKESEKLKISRQIAHDLRAPLAILESDLLNDTNLSTKSTLAINKIKEIASGLMPEDKHHLDSRVNFNQVFDELKELHRNSDLEIITTQLIPILKLPISQIDFFRSFSNLIKNSFEANASKIVINLTPNNNILFISFADNGGGIDPNHVPDILKGATTKVDGNGIGLSSFYNKILSVNGNLEIKTNINEGFILNFEIPITDSMIKKRSYALIDDDKFIRLSWKNKATIAGVELITFESIQQFLEKCIELPQDTFICVDSCLKEGVKGEVEAKKIYDKGFSEIYLSTGYNKSDFNLSEIPWIKDVVSKAPPF